MPTALSPFELQRRLSAPSARDQAFLDVRDGGEYNEGHIAGTTLLPRAQVESRLSLVVPDRATTIALIDSDGRRARLTARTVEALGYINIQVLEGGLEAWQSSGLPVEWGSNVLSKDFGEKVQVQQHVAEVTPGELRAWMQRGEKVVILDARTPEEHAQACIPGSRSLPGGELGLRITDLLAGDRAATVVVHCAGRTRSIIGARTLQRMGIPNVYALKNGTMGWHLAGLELETGSTRVRLPEPSDRGRAVAEAFAVRVAEEDGVRLAGPGWVRERLQRGGNRYFFDVRTQEEYEAGHIPGFQWAPGGQAVQRAEDFIGVPSGDIVFSCDGRARACVVAGWYRQMGYPNVYVLNGGTRVWPELEQGPQAVRWQGLSEAEASVATVPASGLRMMLGAGNDPLVLHVGSSREYERCHPPGAVWLPRGWLELEIAQLAPDKTRPMVCICRDGSQSFLAADTLSGLGFNGVLVLQGGTDAWSAAGYPVERGLQRLALAAADVVRVGTERDQAAMVHYLEWEEALGRKYETGGPD